MKLRAMLITGGLAIIAAANAQQPPTRTFKYAATDAADGNYSAAGNVNLKVVTSIGVTNYLYITGNLGANWVVDGWGKGHNSQVNTIKFFHTETLTLICAGFQDPIKTSGTSSGAQAISLKGDFALFNNATGLSLFDTGMVPIAQMNSIFTPGGPSFTVKQSDGVLRLELERQINIHPTVGPGTYENVGTITVVRN